MGPSNTPFFLHLPAAHDVVPVQDARHRDLQFGVYDPRMLALLLEVESAFHEAGVDPTVLRRGVGVARREIFRDRYGLGRRKEPAEKLVRDNPSGRGRGSWPAQP